MTYILFALENGAKSLLYILECHVCPKVASELLTKDFVGAHETIFLTLEFHLCTSPIKDVHFQHVQFRKYISACLSRDLAAVTGNNP